MQTVENLVVIFWSKSIVMNRTIYSNLQYASEKFVIYFNSIGNMNQANMSCLIRMQQFEIHDDTKCINLFMQSHIYYIWWKE